LGFARKPQDANQTRGCLPVGAMPPSFEILNASNGQPRAIGEHLLGQAGCDPVLPKQRPERRRFLGCG
jgi:hypothetical protein